MCYLVRQQQTATEHGVATGSPPLDRVRSRWVGAGTAALVGSVALAAALVTPPAAAPVVQVKAEPATAAPVASKSDLVPGSGSAERSSLPADDGVPGEVVKAKYGGCSHGM